MIVTCEICHVAYDDVYRLTYCPHSPFEMRCEVHVGKFSKICTRVEEMFEFIQAHGGIES